ncbi:MAG: hypothetical protein JWN04_6045 [Myxococcaceae bacterium]|nr:hypothetical protein [Myxococcaceae bacterium]
MMSREHAARAGRAAYLACSVCVAACSSAAGAPVDKPAEATVSSATTAPDASARDSASTRPLQTKSNTPSANTERAPALPVDEVLGLVADLSITKLSVEAVEARLAKLGAVTREVFPPSNPGVKVRVASAEQRVEATFVIGKRGVPTFYEVQLNFADQPRAATDARFAEAEANLRARFGKPMSTEPGPNQLPSVVFKLKRPYELYLTEEGTSGGSFTVQVGLGVSSEE